MRPVNADSNPVFLGLDAGGTQTRWALADAAGQVLREGHAAGFSGLQLHDAAGCAAIDAVLQEVARAIAADGPRVQRVAGVVAGVTGFDPAQHPQRSQLCALLAAALQLSEPAAQAFSDIELTCRAAFAPGEGVVVIAGTGSIAAFIDRTGTLHRAGGRGAVIDDAGGGHWIAREALRQVWRAEDEAPGSTLQQPLAQALAQAVGGSDWAHTRAWVYGASRGELGTLARVVAAVADRDAAAHDILQRAGHELTRLARALLQRHGALPVALAGRVFELHPCVKQAFLAQLPEGTPLHAPAEPAHHAAARMAAAAATTAAERATHPAQPTP
jgi:glucosamine kinase